LESGHHTDSWLELDRLFVEPSTIRPYASALAQKLAPYGADVACGPLTGGAFLAQLIAAELGLEFSFTERIAGEGDGQPVVSYHIPPALRQGLSSRRVALVDDAISAGSAVRGTLKDLRSCEAQVVVLAALILVGERPREMATELGLPLEWLARTSTVLWTPADCPLCLQGVPLTLL
jgi:orotate phosphoribosyltransferase